MQEISLGTAIIGFTQVCKIAGVPSKYLPLLSVFIGGVLNGVTVIGQPQLVQSIAQGMVTGLICTGLINAVDSRLEKI